MAAKGGNSETFPDLHHKMSKKIAQLTKVERFPVYNDTLKVSLGVRFRVTKCVLCPGDLSFEHAQ